MKSNRENWLFLAVISLTLTAPSAFAANLTWDTSGDGAAITAGSGTWNTTAGNLAWNNGTTPKVAWTQASTTDGSNTAAFAGADGSTDAYVITLAAQMAAESITFNSSGYQIAGSTLALMPTTATAGGITVAAGKTATINSTLRYPNNVAASVVVGASGVLNLGGGTTDTFNPQFAFSGEGTVNITSGTFASNIGSVGNATFNQAGGNYNIRPGDTLGFNITSATQNVAYNLSSGTLSVNGNANAPGVANTHLGIGNGTSTFTSTLAVSGTGILNVGTIANRYGEIRIGNAAAFNGTFNVSGGTVTVGTGAAGNKIYFFKNGSGAGNTASMTQSAGTVTTNGIQFGTSTGTYDATSAANLTLSGGSLYVGERGIIVGSGSADQLPVTIKLQGGTLGANQNWSSSLDMQLGAATIRAQDATSNSRNITLSGILSNETSNGTLTTMGTGTLTLSGNNTYSGGTVISSGEVRVGGGGGTGSIGTGNVTNNASLVINRSTAYTIPGAISGTGSLRHSGTGTTTLTGTNTYTGATTIAAGRLVGSAASLPGDIANAGQLEFAQAAAGTFSAAITGTGSFTKTGGGNLVLAGTSTYTGATSVAAGRLSVNGVLGTTPVAVLAAAELGGSGSIAGPVSIAGGGFLAPGNSIASLATGTASFAAAATFAYEVDSTDPLSLGSAADLLVVSGDLNLDLGNATLLTVVDIASSVQPFVEDTTIFALVNYSGSWNGGLFTYGGTPLADGSRFIVGSQQWEIDYNSSTGGDNFTSNYLPSSSFVTVTVVPEPGTLALMGIGAGFARLACRSKRTR